MGRLVCRVYLGFGLELRVLLESTPIAAPSSGLPQPIPVDLDGDMKIDLLGMTSSSASLLQAWRNTWNTSDSQPTLFELQVCGLVTGRLADLFIALIHLSAAHSAS